MNSNFPIIETQRFILRQFADNDLENVFLGLSHPDVIRYYGVSYENLEAAREQIKWFSDLEKNEKGIWWAICEKDTSEFCGACGLNDWQKKNNKAEVGFWLLPKFWRKGIMREVMPFISNYGFEKMKLHRIEGFVDSLNTNCKKALAKLDFNFEGTMVDCELNNGEYISLDIYAIINGNNKEK